LLLSSTAGCISGTSIEVRAAGASCGPRGSFAPAPALAWEGRLTAAAYAHSLDMATYDYFSHTGRDGRSVAERVSATGYVWGARSARTSRAARLGGGRDRRLDG